MGDTCVNCHDPVGAEAGEIPFVVVNVLDATDRETWCPQCFAHHRAPMEPGRFFPGAFAAVKCSRCGLVTVDCGMGGCGQCGFRGVLALPPKPHALTAPAPAGPAAPLSVPPPRPSKAAS
jgi:hypothetical protein